MIEILNKEWEKYKLVIFTSEEGILIDVKVIKTEFDIVELQKAVSELTNETCEECEKADESICMMCKQSALEDIIKTLEKANVISNVEKSIGLKVYKGIII